VETDRFGAGGHPELIQDKNEHNDNRQPPVLIIDDDHSQCRTLEDILRLEGYDPVSCVTAETGLELSTHRDFVVVILDLRLPDQFGTDVLEKIMAGDNSPRVIIHTAFGSFDSARDSVNFGAFAYVQKGGDPEELIKHVHRAARDRFQEDLLISQSRYKTLIEHGPQAIIVLEPGPEESLSVVEANAKALNLFELSGFNPLDKLKIDRLCSLIVPENDSIPNAGLRSYVDRALNGESPVFECLINNDEGHDIPHEVRLSRYPSLTRNLIIGSLADISERKDSEKALRISEQRFRILFDENPSMYLKLDSDGRIGSINQFGAARLGHDPKDLINSPIQDLCPFNERDNLNREISGCFRSPSVLHRWEMSLVRKDNGPYWVRVTGRVVIDHEGKDSLLLVCEDITEARNLADALSFQATHDPLTSLINRHEFERRLGIAFSTAHDLKQSHALLYLDLDQFKIVNDTCGHDAGDELLRQLSTVLQRHIRSRDTLARLGGDEFGVLLEQCSIDDALKVADTLRRDVEGFRFVWADQSFLIAASIGVVGLTSDTVSITELLSAADTACYAAKDKGRNQVHLHKEDDSNLARRKGQMRWAQQIQTAIDEDLLTLYYQPIVPLRPAFGEGERFELLLRMRRPDGRLESAEVFLPAAERYSLTTSIDRWVVNTALRWLENNPNLVDRLALCCINLSGQSLGNDSLIDHLTAEFDTTSVPAEKICFEITETAAICEMSKAIQFMSRLRARGCVFALDDFGSGLTSFGYLKNLPIDFLKIDGSFVRDILDDPLDLAVVKSINEIGQLMGKVTIAEFVENEALLRKVTEIGVDFAQGYAIGKPAPIASFQIGQLNRDP
jgi:diguanylate cyclase (GGDEF)-like protein/PAS domain S-box-containing protein